MHCSVNVIKVEFLSQVLKFSSWSINYLRGRFVHSFKRNIIHLKLQEYATFCYIQTGSPFCAIKIKIAQKKSTLIKRSLPKRLDRRDIRWSLTSNRPVFSQEIIIILFYIIYIEP